MNTNERLDDHQKFKELAALAQTGTLSESERRRLERHLQTCDLCQQAYEEFALISAEGMSFLATAYGHSREAKTWDESSARERLLAQINGAAAGPVSKSSYPEVPVHILSNATRSRWSLSGLAACVLAVVALGAYRIGRSAHPTAQSALPTASTAPVETAKRSDAVSASQQIRLLELQDQVIAGRQEVSRLRDLLHVAEGRVSALSATNSSRDQQLQRVSEERDKLAAQLREAEQSYQIVQAELTSLRAEHDRVLLHTTSLQTRVEELTAAARDQERRLKDDEQYLASDRDIRELMGARKLYIADVFDVDSGSRTRKPFGRVFYTENKSLIFYAFDLDRQPGVKNASAFQVWGQRDAGSGEKNHATNLGILYMDSESNRRWVLRLEDPRQLAEIDAVFVTVEPHGGSQKPTGKPFLYALLRREANHP